MTKKVTLDISKSGKVKIGTTGFVGEECIKATESLEALLSSDKTRKNVVLESEYYLQNNEQTQQQF